MFGTVARVRIKPGMEQKMIESLRLFETRQVRGFIAEYIYRLNHEPDTYMIAAVFQDRESYFANADSPEQDAFYRRIAETFDGEPEWNDGEIVLAMPAALRK